MRKSVIFKNSGLIEIRAITTIGVSVKEGENPFGYFGTGLKYAIGIILRNGCGITVYRGREKFTFGLKETEIRGAPFSIVTMNGEELGFTSAIGKNWELWMAYRELYCNTLDEGGDVYVGEELDPREDLTHIVVTGESFISVHRRKRDFVLQSEPTEVHPGIEIHEFPSKGYFYKGILVGGIPRDSLYTYNLTKQAELTEDRTLKSHFDAEWAVVGAIKSSNNPNIIEKAVTAGEGFYEKDLHFSWSSGTKPSDTFLEVVERLAESNHPNLNDSARIVMEGYKEKAAPTIVKLTVVQELQLEKAEVFGEVIGLYKKGEYPIVIAETLGKGILGLARKGTIYLAQETFEMGTKMVTITLIEEYIHLKHGHGDMTRGMQNLLFNKIVSLGEELVGEPL